MALEPLQITEETSIALIEKIGSIGHWLQAIGAILIIWLIFQIVNFFINYTRMKKLLKIQEDMKRIEKKIDKLSIR